MRGGGRLGRVVVAHQGNHATMLRGAGEIGMAEDVAGAVHARTLAVPDAEHTIELAFAAQLRLLRAPHGGCGKILIHAGLELDVVRHQRARGLPELLVESAEG
jgi:hypothetical protein